MTVHERHIHVSNFLSFLSSQKPLSLDGAKIFFLAIKKTNNG